MNCNTPGLPVHHQLLELTQTHIHQVSNAIQPSHSLSSPSPPAPNPSKHQGLFQWVNSSHKVARSFSFNISPSNEHPGLTSFRLDWLDLLAVLGTLKSLLQHHSSKAPTFEVTSWTKNKVLHSLPYESPAQRLMTNVTDKCLVSRKEPSGDKEYVQLQFYLWFYF